MSRPSTAQTSKNPTVLKHSAWAKGPPQSSSTPSRSQSPAPSSPIIQTHSRRPSALSGVSIKDGVSVNRSNLGTAKQGSAVTFGSIDDDSAPISSSPAAAPSIKPDVVRSFGSIDAERHETHVNGKSALSSRPSVAVPTSMTSSSTPSPAVSTSSAAKLARTDIAKLFQNPSSAPSTQPSSDTSSPSLRSSGLPIPSGSSSQPPSSSAPPQPSRLGSQQHFTPYQHPQSGPVAPRPPAWPTRQATNGTGPRSQGGPNGAPSQINAAVSSPRLGPMPHNGQPPAMPPPPQMQPPMAQQMPVAWGGYYYQPDQHYYPQWYPPPPHHPPPGGPHGPPTGIPISPRNPPMPLQQGGAGTPTLSHATATSVHPSHPPPPITHPSSSISSISSPPPTPSTTTTRLNANSSTFAPRPKVVIKKADGTEVNIENLKGSSSSPANNASTNGQASTFRQGSPGGTPNRRSVRLESPEQHAQRLAEAEKAKQVAERKVKEEEERRRKEEEERRRKEEEEKERIRKLEEEEQERKRKAEEEEKERIRKEIEEKERARKEAEEKERLRKEEEEKERRRKEEERERLRKEEEERQRKEEEERRQKEEEERQRKEEEERKRKEEEERERLRKEEEEKERQRLEEEKATRAREAEEAAKAQQAKEEGEITEEPECLGAVSTLQDDSKAKEPLRISTSEPLKKRPGRLDLSNTDSVPPSIPSALATARNIDDINRVPYPQGISSPRPELNANAKDGKFRYDRDFLMQFMVICKEKPESLPSLDAIGLEPIDQASLVLQRGGSGRHRQASGGPSAPSRSSSIGLGFVGPGGFPKSGYLNSFTGGGGGGGGGMGNFSTQGSKLTSEERFQLATGRSASVGGPASTPFGRPVAMQRTPSQGGTGGMSRDRVRSQRGKTRDGGKMAAQQAANAHVTPAVTLEPVAPLKVSENRWDRKAIQVDTDSPEFVDRKVKALLNKLTMEKFDSISDQIIEWANKSEKEKDGRTLIQVIRLVFEKATDEAAWSEMYARLCRKMMEQISNKVQDDGIKNPEGKPIAGGQLFRKYLLNRCQEDFERGWVQKEAAAAAAASKATEDEAVKAANEKNKENEDGEVALYSDEYYVAQKAKRQGLGLIKFIGELFKLQMLTERIMHECVKKLLGNVNNPEEEEIESLCKLLTTVGSLLDTPKAHAHMDVYFQRMIELTRSQYVSPRMQFMLQDVIELRERKWVARNAVAAPTTIAQVHEAAAKEKAAHEKEYSQRQISMSRGGSRRGGDRSELPPVNPEGWAVAGNAARPPTKVDLSNFGKINNKPPPQTFGPTSIFSSRKDKRESLSRTSSSSNMFSMLQNADSGADKTPEAQPQRRRLALLPRTKPIESETQQAQESSEDEETTTSASLTEMTDDQAEKKIKEDLKEFFAVRNLDEAEVYFTALPPLYHNKLVDKLVSSAVESKEVDAKLVADLFDRAVSKSLCSQDALEQGFSPCAEIIDDIVIDAPKALPLLAMMMKGAGFDEERRSRLAANSMDSDKLLELLS